MSPPGPVEIAERVAEDSHVLDDISAWIWSKCKAARGVDHFDILAGLPPDIHRTLHNLEPMAIFIVRETLMVLLCRSVVFGAEGFCRSFHWVWRQTVMRGHHLPEDHYKQSGFSAAAGPIRSFALAMLLTRYLRLGMVLFKMHFHRHVVAQARIVAFIWAATSFLLAWKAKAVDRLIHESGLPKARVMRMSWLVSLIITTLGIFTAAEALGVTLKSLLALGGISGLAIGLASKEVVTNFFGGLVLYLTNPFSVGDAIKAGNFAGVVEDIGYFTTRIVGFDKAPVTVPNQVFTNMVITNMSRASHRRLDTKFRVRHQDILAVPDLTRNIVAYLRSHPSIDAAQGAPLAFLSDCKDSSLEISVVATIRKGAGDFRALQQEILVRCANIIVEAGASIGMNMPFPAAKPQLLPPAAAAAANSAPEPAVTAA